MPSVGLGDSHRMPYSATDRSFPSRRLAVFAVHCGKLLCSMKVFVASALLRIDPCHLSQASTNLDNRSNREFGVLREGGSRAGGLLDTSGRPNWKSKFEAVKTKVLAPQVKDETFAVARLPRQ